MEYVTLSGKLYNLYKNFAAQNNIVLSDQDMFYIMQIHWEMQRQMQTAQQEYNDKVAAINADFSKQLNEIFKLHRDTKWLAL